MIKFESEKHLENFIVDCFNDDGICIVNDEEYKSLKQQFNAGDYGVPDLVFYSSDIELIDKDTQVEHLRLHVIELKNEPIQFSHIGQIARYKRYFDLAFELHDIEMEFTLVVPESVKQSNDVKWLIDSLDNINIVEFSINPKSGVKFKQTSGWYKVDETYKSAMELFDINEEL